MSDQPSFDHPHQMVVSEAQWLFFGMLIDEEMDFVNQRLSASRRLCKGRKKGEPFSDSWQVRGLPGYDR
jgi:hypothetical protein